MLISFILFYSVFSSNSIESDGMHRICVSGIDDKEKCLSLSPLSIFVTKDDLNNYLLGLRQRQTKSIEISVIDSHFTSTSKIELDIASQNLSFLSLLKIRNAEASKENFQFINIKQLAANIPIQTLYLDGINFLYHKSSKEKNCIEFKSLILIQSSFLAFEKNEIRKDSLSIICKDLLTDSYSLYKSGNSIKTATVSGKYAKFLGYPKYKNDLSEFNSKSRKSLNSKVNIIEKDTTVKSVLQKNDVDSFLNNYILPFLDSESKSPKSNKRKSIKEVTKYIVYNNSICKGETGDCSERQNITETEIEVEWCNQPYNITEELFLSIDNNVTTYITFTGFNIFYSEFRPSITDLTILHLECSVVLSSSNPDEPVPFVTVFPTTSVQYRPRRARQLTYCVCLQSRFQRCKQSLECSDDAVDPDNYVTGKEESFLDQISDYRTSSNIRLIITHTGTEIMNIDFKTFYISKEITFASASSDITTRLCLREDRLSDSTKNFSVRFNRITNVNIDDIFPNISFLILQNSNLDMELDRSISNIFTDAYSIQGIQKKLTVTGIMAINSSSPLPLPPDRVFLDTNSFLYIPSISGFPHIVVSGNAEAGGGSTGGDGTGGDGTGGDGTGGDGTGGGGTGGDGTGGDGTGGDGTGGDGTGGDGTGGGGTGGGGTGGDGGGTGGGGSTPAKILEDNSKTDESKSGRYIKFSDEDDIYSMTFMLEGYNQSILVSKTAESNVNITIDTESEAKTLPTSDKITHFFFDVAPYGMQIQFKRPIPTWMRFTFVPDTPLDSTDDNELTQQGNGVDLNLTIDDAAGYINFGNLSGNFDLILMSASTLQHFVKYGIHSKEVADESKLLYTVNDISSLTIDFQESLKGVKFSEGSILYDIEDSSGGEGAKDLDLLKNVSHTFRITTTSPAINFDIEGDANVTEIELYLLNETTSVTFEKNFEKVLGYYEEMQKVNFVHFDYNVEFIANGIDYVPYVNITDNVTGVLFSSTKTDVIDVTVDSIEDAYGINATRIGPTVNVNVSKNIGFVLQEAVLASSVTFTDDPFIFAVSGLSRASYIFDTNVTFVPRSRYSNYSEAIKNSGSNAPSSARLLADNSNTNNDPVSLTADSVSFGPNGSIQQSTNGEKGPLTINSDSFSADKLSSIDSSQFGSGGGINVANSVNFPNSANINQVTLGSNSISAKSSDGSSTPTIKGTNENTQFTVNTDQEEVSVSCDDKTLPNNVLINASSDTKKITFDKSWNGVTNPEGVTVNLADKNTELNTEMLNLPNVNVTVKGENISRSSLNVVENKPKLTNQLGFFIFIGIFGFVLILTLGFAIGGCCTLDKQQKKKDVSEEEEEEDEEEKEKKEKKDKKKKDKAAKKEGDEKAKEEKKKAADEAKQQKAAEKAAKKGEKEAAKEAKKGEKEAAKEAKKNEKEAKKGKKEKEEKPEKADKKAKKEKK